MNASSPVTAADVLRFLETIAPVQDRMDWDNVGLLCGHAGQIVRRILVALDPFEDVAQEAVQTGADLIVTHHPIIFKPLRSLSDTSVIGRTLLLLAENHIAVICFHTNLDLAPEGVNAVLARQLDLSNVQVIMPTRRDESGKEWGLLRMGYVPDTSLEAFLPHVRSSLGCPGLRYVSGDRPVHKVAVGGGACADELETAFHSGCDTLITSDVKYNQFWDAHDLHMNLIDAGHFWTEDPVCSALAVQLQKAFPDIPVQKSAVHTDCMKYYV